MNAIEHTISNLKASGPMSEFAIRRYLLDQCSGITCENVKAVTSQVIAHGLATRWLTFEYDADLAANIYDLADGI